MDEQPTTWDRVMAEDARDYHRDKVYDIGIELARISLGIAGAGILATFSFFSSELARGFVSSGPPTEEFKKAVRLVISLSGAFAMVAVVGFAAYISNLLSQLFGWLAAIRFISRFDVNAPRRFPGSRGSIAATTMIIGLLAAMAGVVLILLLVQAIAQTAGKP